MVRIISFILKAPLWLFQKQRYQAFKLQKIDKIIISMDYLTIHQRNREMDAKTELIHPNQVQIRNNQTPTKWTKRKKISKGITCRASSDAFEEAQAKPLPRCKRCPCRAASTGLAGQQKSPFPDEREEALKSFTLRSSQKGAPWIEFLLLILILTFMRCGDSREGHDQLINYLLTT